MTEKYFYIVVNLLKITFIDVIKNFLVWHTLAGFFYVFHIWEVYYLLSNLFIWI